MRGHKKVHWGMPDLNGYSSKCSPSTTTSWSHSVSQLLIHVKVSPLSPEAGEYYHYS